MNQESNVEVPHQMECEAEGPSTAPLLLLLNACSVAAAVATTPLELFPVVDADRPSAVPPSSTDCSAAAAAETPAASSIAAISSAPALDDTVTENNNQQSTALLQLKFGGITRELHLQQGD
jgi:hypothetical protein